MKILGLIFAGSVSLVIGLVIAVPLIMLSAWILTLLWSWFVSPIFGLPELNILQAIGITLVVNYLTHRVEREEVKGEKARELFVKSMLHTLTCLVVGYVVHLLMMGGF